MLKKYLLYSTITLFLNTHAAPTESWTWFFIKKFSHQEITNNLTRTQAIFTKTGVPPFSQLIFSWNAFRPMNGYFSFYAQVHDKKTNTWHSWHKMADWGSNIQQSYANKGTTGTEFCHVRLEVPQQNLADGFRIKVEASPETNMSLVQSLGVNVSDFTKFAPKDFDAKKLSSIKILNVPQESQMVLQHPRAEHMCSPTSCTMLVGYLSKQLIDPLDFAEKVYDKGLDSFGSWPFNTAHAFEQCNGSIFFHVMRLNSFLDIYTYLQRSIPVVVSVRGPLKDAPREYKNGHLLVVIGWDNETQKVICLDPAFEIAANVLTHYDVTSFCQAWERSRHLAYIGGI